VKILLSTLGKGQHDREKGRYDYKESVYLLPDGREVETKLVSKALLDYIEPDEVYVLGTEESLWSLADELIGSYKKVLVPFGKTEEELWEIFRIINEEVDVSGKDIYLDITHGFRAIPLLVSTVVNLFSKVRGARVRGLFYGIFEAKDEKGRTPVVDLLPILELNDSLAKLIEGKLSELDPRQRKRMGNLNKLPKLLKKYSQAVGFTAVNFIPSSVEQVARLINGLENLPKDLLAIDLLKDPINRTYREVERKHTEEWRNQYEIVRWLFNERRYSLQQNSGSKKQDGTRLHAEGCHRRPHKKRG